jgi:hypothetical protein
VADFRDLSAGLILAQSGIASADPPSEQRRARSHRRQLNHPRFWTKAYPSDPLQLLDVLLDEVKSVLSAFWKAEDSSKKFQSMYNFRPEESIPRGETACGMVQVKPSSLP